MDRTQYTFTLGPYSASSMNRLPGYIGLPFGALTVSSKFIATEITSMRFSGKDAITGMEIAYSDAKHNTTSGAVGGDGTTTVDPDTRCTHLWRGEMWFNASNLTGMHFWKSNGSEVPLAGRMDGTNP